MSEIWGGGGATSQTVQYGGTIVSKVLKKMSGQKISE